MLVDYNSPLCATSEIFQAEMGFILVSDFLGGGQSFLQAPNQNYLREYLKILKKSSSTKRLHRFPNRRSPQFIVF